MNLSPQEIEARRTVWVSMSDLFLDTDVSQSYEYIARECAASTFSIEELEKILIQEVAPICAGNLLSVAGAWAGFDESWLIQEILDNRENNSSVQRVRRWLLIYAFRGHIYGHWRKVAPMIMSNRNREA